MNPTVDQQFSAAARRHGDAVYHVRVFQNDDAIRDLPVLRKKKRWDAVRLVLDKLAWTSIEMLDKGKGTLARIDNEGPAEHVEDITGAQATREDRLLNLLLRAQREALTFRDAETTAALKANVDVMREMSTSVATLAGLYRETIATVQERAMALVELQPPQLPLPPGEDGLVSSKLIEELVPKLMPFLPSILAKVLGGAPPPAPPPNPKPNGVKS